MSDNDPKKDNQHTKVKLLKLDEDDFYVTMSHKLMHDPRISPEAKGLMSVITEVFNVHLDANIEYMIGDDQQMDHYHELEKFGYISIQKLDT